MYLLISKHKALEADVQAHEPQLMSVAAVGDELISQGHFGADRIQVIMDLVTICDCKTKFRFKKKNVVQNFQSFFLI